VNPHAVPAKRIVFESGKDGARSYLPGASEFGRVDYRISDLGSGYKNSTGLGEATLLAVSAVSIVEEIKAFELGG
jgi:hypothetical protein